MNRRVDGQNVSEKSSGEEVHESPKKICVVIRGPTYGWTHRKNELIGLYT